MKVYNISAAAWATHKSYPTILRWIREGRFIPDLHDTKGKPLFYESTVNALNEEVKDGSTPEVKRKNGTGELVST